VADGRRQADAARQRAMLKARAAAAK